MLRRWLDVALARPELLAAHAGAWAQFLAAECAPAWRAQQRVWALWALALLFGGLGLGLAGVALMLAMLAPPQQWAQWPVQLVLCAVPAVPLLLALACAWAACRPRDEGSWVRVTRQWEADLSLWHRAAST